MPRKAKTEETVVTEENILHENDMKTKMYLIRKKPERMKKVPIP